MAIVLPALRKFARRCLPNHHRRGQIPKLRPVLEGLRNDFLGLPQVQSLWVSWSAEEFDRDLWIGHQDDGIASRINLRRPIHSLYARAGAGAGAHLGLPATILQ